MNPDWTNALLGGALIGTSASIMLLGIGRITGVAGIVYGLFQQPKGEGAWRIYFLAGLFAGGFTLNLFRPEFFGGTVFTKDWTVTVAGILTGFGTILGSGCTSGHGVCGITRFSLRSLVATLIFMALGILTVAVSRNLGVLW
jgi:uncharacterized protein